ncbi:hypothetical protein HYV64_00650 [Candidatus Shapirobacteria bacterium]|nr:hypothetical protein [Candidatus Shapirobacteria bacterium]
MLLYSPINQQALAEFKSLITSASPTDHVSRQRALKIFLDNNRFTPGPDHAIEAELKTAIYRTLSGQPFNPRTYETRITTTVTQLTAPIGMPGLLGQLGFPTGKREVAATFLAAMATDLTSRRQI